MVIVGGSIENMSRVLEGQTEPFIDEGCIGCAGPCMVVDVAANLQKELEEYKEAIQLERIDHAATLKTVNQYHHTKIKDLKDDNSGLGETIDRMAKKWSRDRATIKNFKTIETRETDRLHKTILDMDVTISDLMDNDRRINGFLDEYRVTVDTRDKTIEELHTKIWELERTLPANFWDVVAGRDATIRKQRTTIEELKDRNIEDLHELYELDKKESDRLKAELKKVVEIINWWGGATSGLSSYTRQANTIALRQIATIVDAYIDASEGPPETPIDESDVLKKIRTLVDDWSVNKKGGRQSFFILSEINDMLKSTQHIDEPQDITVTFAFLELP